MLPSTRNSDLWNQSSNDISAPAVEADVRSVDHAVYILRGARTSTPRALTDNESSAIALIYRQYSPMMLAVAMRMLNSRQDAEDVIHQLFCRLPFIMAQYRGNGLGGWLRRAAVTESLQHLRRNRTRRELDLAPNVDFEAPVSCAPTSNEALSRALQELSVSLREVIVLRYFMDYSHRRVSEILGISEAASEIRACRALKQLRSMLAADGRSDQFSCRFAA